MEKDSHVKKLETEVKVLAEKLKKLEKKYNSLQEKEEVYRLIFQNAEIPITLIDFEKGKYVEFNPAAYKNLGFSEDEFREIGVAGLRIDQLAEDLEKQSIPPRSTLPKKYEYIVKTKNGETRNVMIYSELLTVKEKKYHLNMAVDITEQKNAEKALRDSEEFSSSLLEKSPIPILVIDETLKVKYVNPMLEKLSGYSANELLGITAPFPWWPDNDEDGKGYEQWKNHLFAGAEALETTFRNRHGDDLFVIVTVTPIRKRDKFKYALISWVDITARKRAEEEEKNLRTRYERAQRMESLGTLAGGIAHDFNNLLMGIQGRTSMMLLNKHTVDPDYEHLKGIEECINSAANLTKQLLGFARGGKYEVTCIDPNSLMDNTIEMFSRAKKEIRIHKKLDENIWSVEVDQGQITQVLMNIFINAWQAMPGGGDLYIESENIKISGPLLRAPNLKPGKYIRLTITDTGVGMDTGTMERIFDPFFTTKDIGRGTGLGLASVYGIIDNHAGFIDVYSVKGEGSTFKIYLPASENAAVEEKEIPGEMPAGDETILLIDDEDIIIDVSGKMLRSLGYKVITAKSGKEAIEIYNDRKDAISMVILDMVMPDMNGSQTFDELKKLNPQIKVLLSSGYSVNGKAHEIMKKGCKGFI